MFGGFRPNTERKFNILAAKLSAANFGPDEKMNTINEERIVRNPSANPLNVDTKDKVKGPHPRDAQETADIDIESERAKLKTLRNLPEKEEKSCTEITKQSSTNIKSLDKSRLKELKVMKIVFVHHGVHRKSTEIGGGVHERPKSYPSLLHAPEEHRNACTR